MPITLTFDIDGASIQDGNDRTRIIACFERLGWEHVGGSAWRYPALGSQNVSEDWFNHVIPALMYFRSIVEHADLDVYNFTIDAHSEAGHRGRAPYHRWESPFVTGRTFRCMLPLRDMTEFCLNSDSDSSLKTWLTACSDIDPAMERLA